MLLAFELEGKQAIERTHGDHEPDDPAASCQAATWLSSYTPETPSLTAASRKTAAASGLPAATATAVVASTPAAANSISPSAPDVRDGAPTM